MANSLDPATVFQLLDDQAIDRHAANVLHIAARARLAVGDDGQRFQRGAGVFGRLFGVQTV